MSEETFVTVGRRKTATARVRLTRGTGKIVVNGSEPRAYFKTEEFANAALSPLKTVEMADQVDITIKAQGGGLNGQAGAVRLGMLVHLKSSTQISACRSNKMATWSVILVLASARNQVSQVLESASNSRNDKPPAAATVAYFATLQSRDCVAWRVFCFPRPSIALF